MSKVYSNTDPTSQSITQLYRWHANQLTDGEENDLPPILPPDLAARASPGVENATAATVAATATFLATSVVKAFHGASPAMLKGSELVADDTRLEATRRAGCPTRSVFDEATKASTSWGVVEASAAVAASQVAAFIICRVYRCRIDSLSCTRDGVCAGGWVGQLRVTGGGLCSLSRGVSLALPHFSESVCQSQRGGLLGAQPLGGDNASRTRKGYSSGAARDQRPEKRRKRSVVPYPVLLVHLTRCLQEERDARHQGGIRRRPATHHII